MKDLISLMPEVLAALQSTGANVSLAQDLEDAIEAGRKHTVDLIARYQEKVRALEADNHTLVAETDELKRRGEPSSLAEVWRINADEAEAYGQSDRADTLRECAAEVERLAAPQPAEPDVLPGEAIFGFAAWLTSLKTPVTFSECHGAAIGADLAAAYNTSQGFDQVREDFHKRLKPYPKYEPSQPAEPVKILGRNPTTVIMDGVNPVKVPTKSQIDDAMCKVSMPFFPDETREGADWIIQQFVKELWEIAASQPQQQAGAASALKFAAQVVELYDDATMRDDYMIDSGECAGILTALADYFTRFSPQPQQIPEGYRLQPLSEFDAMMDTRTIPEGYRLVPTEPTVEMLLAGDAEFGKRKIPSISGICYKAMLEAAPKGVNSIPPLDDESDALTIAYMLGLEDGKKHSHADAICYRFLRSMPMGLKMLTQIGPCEWEEILSGDELDSFLREYPR